MPAIPLLLSVMPLSSFPTAVRAVVLPLTLAGVASVAVTRTASAQGAATATGAVTGTITTSANRPLAGAIVHADAVVASANTDGVYRLGGVSAGTRRLEVRYLGYQPETVTVTVVAGRSVRADIVMRRPVQDLQTVRVVGQVAGQVAAQNQQRAADNVSSVVDNELVGRLPDQNLAEALARVPGVAVDRDQGEGRFVQIRGTRQDLNSLSINGERVPTTENSRAVPMDIVPADQAAVIQVSKTLTPDMDADAIGGNVNIVTRSARPGITTASFTAAGGRNELGKGPIGNFGANVGRRFGPGEKLGLVLGGTYYRNDRASQNFEGSWCVQNGDCGPAGSASAASPDAPRLWELRDYPQVNRVRQGANGTFDYNLNDQNRLFVRGTFNQFSDDEVRFRTRFSYRAGSGSRWTMVTPDSGIVTGARLDRDVRLRKVISKIMTAQFGGEHGFGSGQQLTWSVGTARAREDRPDVRTAVFRESNVTLGYNFADAERPRSNVITGAYDDPTRFPFTSLTHETRLYTDDDVSARVNYLRPFTLGTLPASIKVGGVARLKQRNNSVPTTVTTAALGQNSLGATGATLYSQLVTSQATHPIFGGDYDLGRTLEADRLSAFIRDNPTAFTVDQFNSDLTSAGAAFEVDENVYGGYLMGTVDVGPVRLIPGLRVEATHLDNTANRLAVNGSTLTITPVNSTSSYTNLFPSLTGAWRIDEFTVVRAAVTTSLVRPNYQDQVPSVRISTGDVTANVGNPELRPTKAFNLDLSAEHYLRGLGFLSAGAFYKDLTDFIYSTARPRTADEVLGPDATTVIQPVNGPKGKLWGIEAAWQQTLSFLPGALDGLGVNLNYTWTHSESTFPLRGADKFAIPGQTGNSGNAGIFYDKGRLSLRTGVNYAGKFLVTVSPLSPQADTYRLARLQVDAAGSVQLVPNAKLFVEAINLSNTPFRGSVGDRDNRGGGGDDPSYEFYKPWYTVGVRLQR